MYFFYVVVDIPSHNVLNSLWRGYIVMLIYKSEFVSNTGARPSSFSASRQEHVPVDTVAATCVTHGIECVEFSVPVPPRFGSSQTRGGLR